MTTSLDFKDWWNEARANNGFCTVEESWWDADGSKLDDKRIIPAKLSDAKLSVILTETVLSSLPTHYFAVYSNATWKKLNEKLSMTVVDKQFEAEGRKVVAHVRFDLYKGLYIETPAMADAVDMFFAEWSKVCEAHPGAASRLSVYRNGKELAIKATHAHYCNEGERLVMDAAFNAAMAGVKANPDFGAWVSSVAKLAGRYSKRFVITQDIWYGPMGPAMNRAHDEYMKKDKTGTEGPSDPEPELHVLDI